MIQNQLHIKTLKISSQAKQLVNVQDLFINDSLAILGESGSGKSLILKTLLGLLPHELNVTLEFSNNTSISPNDIAFIPQNPFTAFSPLSKIQDQLFLSSSEIDPILKELAIDTSILHKFPSQLSGGQLQRLLFAIAIAKNPKLLLLDEPTTALDMTNKKIILELIKQVIAKQIQIIFVTHDVSSIENICKDIIVIKQGTLIESGHTNEVLQAPQHEYTQQLINSNFKLRGYRN